MAPSSDIEMLSAQSNDGRAMETQNDISTQSHNVYPNDKSEAEVKDIPNEKEGPVKPEGSGNTISEDTKALVKQALFNATKRRQRAGSFLFMRASL